MRKFHYFVAYDYKMHQKNELKEAINQAFRGTKLKGYFADLELRSNGEHILKKIEEMILITHFGIYDITTSNPNVTLELGLAKGANKRLYIIHKKGTQIVADLQGIDRIEYNSYKKLTEEIKEKIVDKEIKILSEIKESTKYEYNDISEEKVMKKCCRLYQAETLLHRFGHEIKDESASNKKAWFADLTELRGHIIYGPYDELPEIGKYIVFFKMKIDDNSSTSPILLLDVSHLASRIIRGINFNEPNKYQLFGVKFECRKIVEMEYRAFNQIGERKIWIDYVAIIKFSD